MPGPGRSRATDPGSYTNRDLLLITQMLHTTGLVTPEQVVQSDRLDEISHDWFEHKCTMLSRKQGLFPVEKRLTGQQLVKLFENMLDDNTTCATSTDLANHYYFARVAELEQNLSSWKTEFQTLIEG